MVDYHAAFDEMWSGLPVVRVVNWSALTPAFLDAEWAAIEERSRTAGYNVNKIYWPYWFDQLTRWMVDHQAAA